MAKIWLADRCKLFFMMKCTVEYKMEIFTTRAEIVKEENAPNQPLYIMMKVVKKTLSDRMK